MKYPSSIPLQLIVSLKRHIKVASGLIHTARPSAERLATPNELYRNFLQFFEMTA
jgi:hypothetical protein